MVGSFSTNASGVGGGAGLVLPPGKVFGPDFAFLSVDINVFYKENQLH